jgi:hypothetical protein
VLPLLLGLFLIVASSVVKVIRVARTAEVPVAMRGGAVMAWVFGTLAIAVLPAFAALAILDLATDLVRLDGGLEQLGAAMLWVGICDVANIGRLVSPKPEERGTDVDLTKDRRLLFLVAMMATVAYAVALLIAVGFVDDGHVALGVAIALGFVASAATIQARPGGPGMGPLTRRPIDPDGATEDRPDGDRRFGAGPDGDDDRAAGDDDRATRDDALALEDPLDLGAVDARQPLGRERDRARDVAAARLARRAPAVVGAERPRVDDDEARVGELSRERVGGDRRGRARGGSGWGVEEVGHRGVPSVTGRGNDKTPAIGRGPVMWSACDCQSKRTPRDTVHPAGCDSHT